MSESYVSVCDGIGAAEEAFGPLGWKPVLLSEIDAFPRAVSARRHGAVDIASGDGGLPLWGDFTALRVRHFLRYGIELPSMLVGGTPCQGFSIAGLRGSLADARGNLTLSFVRLANALDSARFVRGLPALAIFWENVPGVLSTKDNAFGCFLAALVGADAPLVPPGGKPGKPGKWTRAGMAVGPRRSAAWCIKDAQYFGLAQRRERVFVVASARDGFDPSEVLFEPEGVRRDTPPRREAGQNAARPIAAGSASSGGIRNDADTADNLIPGALRSHPFPGSDTLGPAGTLQAAGKAAGSATQQDAESNLLVATTLRARDGAKGVDSDATDTLIAFTLRPPPSQGAAWRGDGADNLVAHTLRGEGFDASEDGTGRGTGRGTPLVAVNSLDGQPIAFNGRQDPISGPITGPIDTNSSTQCIAFSSKDHGADADFEVSPTIRAGNHNHSHANAGVPPAVAFSIMPMNSGKDYKARETEVAQPLMASGPVGGNQGGDFIVDEVAPLSSEPVAFALRGREGGAMPEVHEGVSALRAASGGSSRDYVAFAENSRAELRLEGGDGQSTSYPAIASRSAVRRLTPEECERLQGFPAGFTKIPYRGKPASACPDGPRYKALGNSWAVPCVAWIGWRLDAHLKRIACP